MTTTNSCRCQCRGRPRPHRGAGCGSCDSFLCTDSLRSCLYTWYCLVSIKKRYFVLKYMAEFSHFRQINFCLEWVSLEEAEKAHPFQSSHTTCFIFVDCKVILIVCVYKVFIGALFEFDLLLQWWFLLLIFT